MKRPAFQFYPGDWLNDAGLRSVSVGARGLWIEMICLMHQGTDYGYLKIAGQNVHASVLARMCGARMRDVELWLRELEASAVFSRDDSGCIYSRRMIRDEQLRKTRADCGALGKPPLVAKPQPPLQAPATPEEASGRRRGKRSIQQFIADCDAVGESYIGKADQIFDYADTLGIPYDYLQIAWAEFVALNTASGKLYMDWRAVFRNAVRGNWLRLWYKAEAGWLLTTGGQQAQLACGARAHG